MTYPMDGLAIIAPILFMVMIIGFPLIGLAVGWKRALYWGGGNFLFYVIGLIVWKCAGSAIGTAIAEFLKQSITSLKDVSVTKLATSVAAPVFFLLVLIVGNLFLLINYYAWFKRVAKIKFDIAAKRAIKKTKKEYKEQGKKIPNKFTAKFTLKKKGEFKVTEKPYGARAGNRLIGLACMEMLMLPVTLSLTNAVFYTTTSSSTRANHKFAESLYNSLNKSDKNLSWFSYYGGTSGDDLDGLLSGLELYNTELESDKIEITDPNNPEGDKLIINVDHSGDKATVLDLVTNNVTKIVTEELSTTLKELTKSAAEDVYTKAYQESTGETTEEKEADAQKATNSFLGVKAQPINKLAGVWNGLVDSCQLSLQALFNSSNITELIKEIVEKQNASITIDNQMMTDIFGENRTEGLYWKIVKQYKDAVKDGASVVTIIFETTTEQKTYEFEFKITILKELVINAASLVNLQDLAMSFIEFKDEVVDSDRTIFKNAINDIISLILIA